MFDVWPDSCVSTCLVYTARTMAWHTPGACPSPHSCPVIVRAPASVHCDTHHITVSTSQPSQPAPSPSLPIGHQTFSLQQRLSFKVKWLEQFVNDMTTLLSDLFMLWMFWASLCSHDNVSHVYFSRHIIFYLFVPSYSYHRFWRLHKWHQNRKHGTKCLWNTFITLPPSLCTWYCCGHISPWEISTPGRRDHPRPGPRLNYS